MSSPEKGQLAKPPQMVKEHTRRSPQPDAVAAHAGKHIRRLKRLFQRPNTANSGALLEATNQFARDLGNLIGSDVPRETAAEDLALEETSGSA